MGNIRRFAAVNTKAMTLEGKLLKPGDYHKLLNAKNLMEVLSYLRENTAYKEVVGEMSIYEMQVSQLEYYFKKHIIKQYEKLIHYFTGAYKKLFRTLLMRYEIEDIKLSLRKVLRGESLFHEMAFVTEDLRDHQIDRRRFQGVKTIEAWIEALKGTKYHDLLKPYLEEIPERRLFYMEMALDGYYFQLLYNQAQKIDREDKKAFLELLGKNVDILNLQWIYRGLKFYKLSPEELLNYTLYYGKALGFGKLKELCYASSEQELVEKMIHTQYGFLFDNQETLDLFMERRMKRYLYFLLLGYRKREKMNLLESIIYMHLLEYEMSDVVSIMEGIRYGLAPGDAKRFLVRKL